MTERPQRQRDMLRMIAERAYVPVGLTELIDPDYAALVADGLVEHYTGMGSQMLCHLTDAGRKLTGLPVHSYRAEYDPHTFNN